MRNIFITRRQHFVDQIKPEIVIDSLGREFVTENPINNATIEITDSLDLFHQEMRNHDEVGADTENNGLHPIYCIPLLAQFAFPEDIAFIIDKTSIKEDYLSPYKNKLYLGFNWQYDYKVIKWHDGVELRRCEDIMINEQIINRGSGRVNSLEESHWRRLLKPMPEDKHTRTEFVGMGVNALFRTKHILYGGYDAACLFKIREIQRPIIEDLKLHRRIYAIAQPLVPILGDMCLNGFTLNTTNWKVILDRNKKEKFAIELELDKEIIKFSKDHLKLRGGIWTNPRRKAENEQLDIFGASITIGNENLKNVSYSSQKQLTKLFTILREPIPQKEDKTTERQTWKDKVFKNSFAEEALEQYKIEYPSSRMIEFINLLLEYRKVEKAINSFGEIFLKDKFKANNKAKKYKNGYMNTITHKVHTVYNQEATKNGRLSSGDVKNGFYNSQQVIKEAQYRNCFTLTQEEIDNDWWVSTYDLSQAELFILGDKSGDKNLIKYLDGDIHSFLATAAYSRIVEYIISTMPESRAADELYNLLKVNKIQKLITNENNVPLTPSQIAEITNKRIEYALRNRRFDINKKDHPDIRDPYKNVTYGIVYGAGEGKISETLNIAPYYAKLTIEGMGKAIPDAYNYLNNVARAGVKNGYIIYCERTQSRHWFQSWIEAREQGRFLSQKEKAAIERFCKNVSCSGPQADMIKESMVNIHNYITENQIEYQSLLQVHDELVAKHRGRQHGEAIGNIMMNTCNLYLTNVKMKVSGKTEHYWYK